MTSHQVIADSLKRLFAPDAVVELRIPHTRKGTVSGYFNTPDELAAAAARWSGKAAGMYCTINPVTPALLARANNRLVEYVRHTTSDTDILHRCWLLLDFDPGRPAGISSTDTEHDAALARARECVAWLRGLGFAAFVLADSGNGAHVLVRIDLPNDAASTALVKRCVESVALRFSDDAVVVDLGVYNPARLWKVYGTLAAKGDATPDRPHRLARILEAPAVLTPEPHGLLEKLAALAPAEPKTERPRGNSAFDLERWIADHPLAVRGPSPWQGGRKWIFSTCPWNADHTDHAAYLIQFANGPIAAGCHHNGCQGKGWPELRDVIEPGWREKRGAPWPTDADAPPAATEPQDLSQGESNGKLHASRVTLRHPSELVARPISWRVEGVIPDGMLTVLHAIDKVGKTIFAWEAAQAVLRNTRLFGTFAATRGRVVLALLDDPHDLTVERRNTLGLTHCEDLRIVTPLDADLSDPVAFLEDFKKACEEFKPSLIVLDALYHFAPAGRDSMNDAARMHGIMAEFNSLAEELHAAVLLIAHDRKDGSDVAGSHVIRATAKALLHLTRPKWSNEEEEDDGRRILAVVSKMTGEARHLLRCQGVGAWSYLGRGDSAHQARNTWAQDRVLMWLKEGGEGIVPEVAKAAKIRNADALVALTALIEEGLVENELQPRAGGKKGKGRLVYRLKPIVPDPGNENPKEKGGNDRSASQNPAPDAAQSGIPIVPSPWNQAGTIGQSQKPTIDGEFSEIQTYRSQNPFFKGEDGNDSFSDPADEGEKPPGGQESCRFCGCATCLLTPWGRLCRLSPEDLQRWEERADSRDAGGFNWGTGQQDPSNEL